MHARSCHQIHTYRPGREGSTTSSRSAHPARPQVDPNSPDLTAVPPTLPLELEHLNDHALLKLLAGATPLAVQDLLFLGLQVSLRQAPAPLPARAAIVEAWFRVSLCCSSWG